MIYKSIKLISGEMLACGLNVTESEFQDLLDTQRFIDVHMPVSFYSVKFNDDGQVTEVVGIQPWMPISKDDVQRLSVQAIIGYANMDDKAIEGYQDFWAAFEERERELDLEDQAELGAVGDDTELTDNSASVTKIYH